MKKLKSCLFLTIILGILSLLIISPVYGYDQYIGDSSTYTVSVPAKLSPGETGQVSVEGYWPSYKTVLVTADNTVELKCNNRSVLLNVNFAGIEGVGSDYLNTYTKNISVEDFSVQFGTWTGTVNYYVDLVVDEEYLASRTIPTGGVYYTGLTDKQYRFANYDGYENMYVAGDLFPETVNVGDVYVYQDWEYRYGYAAPLVFNWYSLEYMGVDGYSVLNVSPTGWSVVANRNSENDGHYSGMLSYVNNVPVTNAMLMFGGIRYSTECASVGGISSELVTMYNAFSGTTLQEMPEIPDGVINLSSAFDSCDQMKNPKTIPASVINMDSAFVGCTALEGVWEINAQITETSNLHQALAGIDFNLQDLTLTGTCPLLDELGLTGDNYCTECNGTCRHTH